MTKLELLTVLRSVDLALEVSEKEQVQKLIKKLIADAEGKKENSETAKG